MSGVVHGGVTSEELAWAAQRGIEVVDLSASLNPYGPHPDVVAAAQGAVFERYPEPDSRSLRAAYARRHGLRPEGVLAGNGSTELIYLLARASHAPALIVGPTFGEYRAACAAAGLETCEVTAGAGQLSFEVAEVLEYIRGVRPGLVFLCNPNNPTGQVWDSESVRRLACELTGYGGVLVVDEAYLDFVDGAQRARTTPEGNVVVLRSMTKMHAIPGLRLGFLLGDPEAIARVGRLQPAWSVSAPATAAALAALQLRDWERECAARVSESRERLKAALRDAGLRTGPSEANFVFIDVADAPPFRRRLFERGWVVRDCTSFGLPAFVRIAIPRAERLDQLIDDILECVK